MKPYLDGRPHAVQGGAVGEGTCRHVFGADLPEPAPGAGHQHAPAVQAARQVAAAAREQSAGRRVAAGPDKFVLDGPCLLVHSVRSAHPGVPRRDPESGSSLWASLPGCQAA